MTILANEGRRGFPAVAGARLEVVPARLKVQARVCSRFDLWNEAE
jgi:hypothetical protein